MSSEVQVLQPAPARALQQRLLPHGWGDVLRQLSLFLVAYFLYSLVRGMAEVDSAAAFAHARDIIQIERALHIFVEPQIQAWAMGSHVLMDVLSWLYLNAQSTVSLGALVYIYLRHNRSFYFVRNMLAIAMAIALIGYTVFPTAPPRFLPEWGFVDSVAAYTGVHVSHASASMSALFNPYAAVPSMHIAFSLMIAWPLSRLVRPRLLKAMWALYPFLILFVIIATANHFIFDSVLGALTAALAAYGARRIARIEALARLLTPAPAGAGG